jgi:hypothetical protein
VAKPPPWGWLATPWAMGVVRPPPDRPPSFFFFFLFIDLKGWLGHPLRPWGWPNHPHGPRGASHPLWGGSATPLFFLFLFFLFIDLKGWLSHPLRPWGWFGHPQIGRYGGGRTTPMAQGVPATPYGVVRPPLFFFLFFLFIDLKGWLGHPLRPWGWFGHPQIGRSGGGRTTPMAQGVPATPMGVVRPPLFFFFFFLILIYFIFKIKFLKNNILLVKNGAF